MGQSPATPLFVKQVKQMRKPALSKYWKIATRITLALLFVWFIVSYLFGILLVETLNEYASLGGFPLGFWFAHQGSIFVFIILILVYCIFMDRLDASVTENGGEQ